MSRAAMKHGPRDRRVSQNHAPADRLRPMLLGALVAVFVARPLLVSESAATVAGDGLPFVMLTLVLAIVWWAAGTARPRFPARLGWVDLAWLALIAWQAAGTLLAVRTGAARAAINVCWEWVGLGLGFVLLRQLIADDRELRALAVVMIALAVVLSAYGLFQFYVSLPAVREQFDRDPEAVLRAAGVVAPPGSPARLLFRERLKSTEPMATFALANSLAGFLATWLIVLIGVACLERPDGQDPAAVGRRWAIAAAAALPIAICLILTKSRSAYGACLLGMAGIAVARRMIAKPAARTPRVAIFVAAAVIVVLIAIMVEGQALDREILTEATKSLSYRWHYWYAALQMVRNHPWFGCGLGNFQDIYTQYKLPEASEVVADPHNFLLEIWSTSGTPALVAFLAIFVVVAIELRRTRRSAVAADHATPQVTGGSVARPGVFAVAGGAVSGFALAFLVGLFSTVTLPIELMVFGLLATALAALASRRWIEHGTLGHAAPLIALGALLVNLLAAGGIGFAGVAGSLWLLLAILLCLGHPVRLSGERSRPIAAVLLAASIAIAAICHYSAYLPVLRCRMLLAQADGDPAQAEQALRAAAAADPLADEPWKGLAALAMNRWRHEGDGRWLRLWQDAQAEILRRRPQS
ncbi:MAG TPA: O-antigen ligase family protein, partial [Pirellulales bacterium]|nr:O-antigen ligase family protein [Pirellulales bacterium]